MAICYNGNPGSDQNHISSHHEPLLVKWLDVGDDGDEDDGDDGDDGDGDDGNDGDGDD